MSLFDRIFKNRPKERGRYEGVFKLLNGYAPAFHDFSGELYESELVRASINALATHISKLDVRTYGAAKPALQGKLSHGPNQFQSWSQFLSRAATIYFNTNTLFITPIWDEFGQISGIYTPLPTRCEVVQYNDVPYLRYSFTNGDRAAVELDYCGVMTRMQYRSDLFGENNAALLPTMDMIKINEQGIKEGVKSSATYRFMAQLANFSRPTDLANERKRFTSENLSKDAEGGGLLLFPSTYNNIQQIKATPFTVDAEQMKEIRANVFEYFGVNEDILQNKFNSETWAAFYEGAIEPWAIQFSEIVTRMLFTFREQSAGNYVMATSNRLQYMSNKDKVSVTSSWADHGLATVDEIRQVWNLPPLPDGKGAAVPVRGEFYDLMTGDKINTNEDEGGEQDDDNGNS